MIIRQYKPNDFDQLAIVYQSAFAEPPWDEYMKCVFCNENYGIKEAYQNPVECKKCGNPLALIEFWSKKEIKADLDFAFSQKKPIVIVAEKDGLLIGTVWGYILPIEKFPFLNSIISQNSNYIDEIAIHRSHRRKGIGEALGKEYLKRAIQNGDDELVLRTDRNNEASMGLFKKLGFENTSISDPQYPLRLYLRKKLK